MLRNIQLRLGVALAAIAIPWLAAAHEGTTCFQGEDLFPSISVQRDGPGLTQIQEEHLKYLENENNEINQINAENLFVFSWFRYLDKFSLIGPMSCKSNCVGSLFVKIGEQIALKRVLLSRGGGILVGIEHLGKDGKPLNYDSATTPERIRIRIGVMSDEKTYAYIVSLNAKNSDLGRFSLARSVNVDTPVALPPDEQRTFFRNAQITLERVPIRSPKLPYYVGPTGTDCGAFEGTRY